MGALVAGAVLTAGTLRSVHLIRARLPKAPHTGPAHASFAAQMLATVPSIALAAGLTLVLDGLLA